MVKWDSGGKYKDDFTATEGNYMLRCEELDLRQWWWCVYYGQESINEGVLPYQSDAKEAAEQVFLEHRSKVVKIKRKE